MTQKLFNLACLGAAALGLVAAALVAFYLLDQRSEGYSRTVYLILIGLVACEALASVVFALRRSTASGVVFIVLATPLAVYELETSVAGVGITYFTAVGAVGAGCLALLLKALARRSSGIDD